MKRTCSILLCALLASLALSCANRGGEKGEEHQAPPAERHFKMPDVPFGISSPEAKVEYVLMHMWDDFDGVGMDEIEGALANFIGIMEMAPMDVAQKAMGNLFDRICAAERADTSAHYYVLMTQMISKYLYDPNSPLRNEDYYLPFVSRMAESDLTSEDMRQAYRYEAEACSICQYGTVAEDFVIRTASGKDVRLHDIKARRTLLFFSNPGCDACLTIVNQLLSVPELVQLVASREVAVVNVYIDEDLDAWKKYVDTYPPFWTSGYDLKGVVRGERIYDVRAIPSLYLLDEDKRVLMKDAPTERVIDAVMNQR